MIASEERDEALEPLYSNVCACCGQLLGKDTGSEIHRAQPWQVRGVACDVRAQPAFLLLWHPQTLAVKIPACFTYETERVVREGAAKTATTTGALYWRPHAPAACRDDAQVAARNR